MFTVKPYNIGQALFNTFHFLGEIYKLFFSAVKYILYLRKPPVRSVLFKQVYFTGIEALSSLLIIGPLVGLVIIAQISNLMGLASEERTLKILIWIVLRELGPLLTAIIVMARSGTAIAAELGSMKVGQEIKSLEILGISPAAYLIMPRILGVTLAVMILTFYFEVFTILGGVGIASFFWDLRFLDHFEAFLNLLTPLEIIVSMIKSFFFGIIISTIACYQGYIVGETITQIPQAAARAVIQNLFLILIFDGIITMLAF